MKSMRPYNFHGVNEMEEKFIQNKIFEKKRIKQTKLLPFDEFDEMNKRNRNGMKQITLFSFSFVYIHFSFTFSDCFCFGLCYIENGEQEKKTHIFFFQFKKQI